MIEPGHLAVADDPAGRYFEWLSRKITSERISTFSVVEYRIYLDMYKPLSQSIIQNSDDAEDSDAEFVTSPEQPLVADSSSCLLFDKKSLDGNSRENANGMAQDGRPPLSTARKIVLLLSILNCLAFTVIFLWILPCNYDTCQSPIYTVEDVEWDLRLDIKGPLLMDVATSPSSKADEILVIVSGRYNNSNTTRLLVIEGIRVASSKELWKTNWTGIVQYINCHLININNDKINDCILHSTERGLIAVDSGTGLLLWQLHSHHETSPDTRAMNVTKLRSVSDVDGDTTPDLLAVVTNMTQSLLMIISGRNGQLIWQQTLDPNCSQKLIHVLNTAKDPPCLNQSGIPDFIANHVNLNEVLKDDWDQPRWETSNRGTCPAECSADLFVTDPTNEAVNWNNTFDHSAISPPTVLLRKGPNRFRVAFNLESHSQKVNGTWIKNNRVQIIDLGFQPTRLTLSQVETDGPTYFILHDGLTDYIITATITPSAAFPGTIMRLKKTHL